jgi:hypothetical protein
MVVQYFNAKPKKGPVKDMSAARARAVDAARLRKSGMGWAEIAEVVGYSNAGAAYNAVMTCRV